MRGGHSCARLVADVGQLEALSARESMVVGEADRQSLSFDETPVVVLGPVHRPGRDAQICLSVVQVLGNVA